MARMMMVDGRILKMTAEMEAEFEASLPPPARPESAPSAEEDAGATSDDEAEPE